MTDVTNVGEYAFFAEFALLGVASRATRVVVVWWESMSSVGSSSLRLAVAAAVWAALLTIPVPSAGAAPATDAQGYLDSTARCNAPNSTVVFGSTETSRVAICKTSGGQYEYRGVRVRDGASLIRPAAQSGEGKFVAENDGIDYTITASSLVVSSGGHVIRDEPMVDFHGAPTPQAPATSAPATATPTTPLPPPLPAEVGG